jgi:hypothetical protein
MKNPFELSAEQRQKLRDKVRQAALVESHRDANPSEVTDVYWLYAERENGGYPEHTENGGKWLVFVPMSEIDDVWHKIKQATEEGRLGSSAKVSTMQPNSNSSNPNIKVICVYTYDWTDENDVRRVRAELRKLGIDKKIPYKADEDTFKGRYVVNGNTRISKYYE